MPLDLFLVYLTDDVLSRPAPPGFSTEPPAIHVASTPTLLLFVNGSPVLTDVAGTGLRVVANANWPTFKDPAGKGTFYLLDRDLWLSSPKLESGWEKASSLPAGFEKLPADSPHAELRSAMPLKKSTLPVPKVFFSDRPAELIVTEGEAVLEAIPGADGLTFVANTKSPLFKLKKKWYFLVAGRWFKTTHLSKGPWIYSAELPAAFSKIPSDRAMAAVRASVPGTVEARMASLEALLPNRVEAPRDGAPPVEITYAGESVFEPITGTEVARAVNSGYDVIQYKDQYYLCYAGIWYQASAPVGPWMVASVVPPAIYAIPPNSPAYHVTQVAVASTTATTVVYTYPPAYSSSLYVVYGVPYYGTGWYYPPYIYGGIYYPFWGSYGYGNWYNPATGGYGSRSVWYGPYGGYSYTEGYNPSTGRYGYLETAWDSDEWASSGAITTGDGRTATISGEQTRTGGSSTITGSDESVDMTTKRQAGSSVTAIEGSGGGQGVSFSGEGPGRTTVGQSGSCDLYAGHNGNAYKKTEDGWQHYDDGGWQPVDTPEREQGGQTRAQAQQHGMGERQTSGGRDVSQLDRDRSARQRGTQQFQQRSGSHQRGSYQGGRRSGGGRRR